VTGVSVARGVERERERERERDDTTGGSQKRTQQQQQLRQLQHNKPQRIAAEERIARRCVVAWWEV